MDAKAQKWLMKTWKDARGHRTLGKMRVKTTRRQDLTPSRTATNPLSKAQKQELARAGSDGTPRARRLGRRSGAATVGSSTDLVRRLKMGLPYVQQPHFWGHAQKNEKQDRARRDICTLIFPRLVFTTAERWKQPNAPRRMDGLGG